MDALRELEWDSAQFGFPVARIDSSVGPAELPGILRRARKTGIRLAYLAVPSQRERLSPQLLRHFNGTAVDVRVTYVAELATLDNVTDAADDGDSGSGYELRPFDGTEPDEDLVRLARASGEHSRFNTDPRIERRVFEAIYDAWIARSVRREIADLVIVAQQGDRKLGMVTVGQRDSTCGEIGLLAVDTAEQGRGIGRRLVGEALNWARLRSFEKAQVVTQMGNRPACAMYEACGYAIENVDRTYHFWLG